jgi:hypothetical protein
VHWYDLPSGALRCSAQLFDGARVHGLHVAGGGGEDVCVAAHGGRRVSLFRLHRGERGGSGAVELLCALPSFASWVLDVRALREDGDAAQRGEPPPLLAGASSAFVRTRVPVRACGGR